MRHYKVNKIDHTVFESAEEVPNNIKVVRGWRECHIGDWVKADDGCVIQILRKGTMVKAKGRVRTVDYVGTCTGTFIVSNKTKMDTSKRVNIYSISGNVERTEQLDSRENLSTREELFGQYLAGGMDARQAYLKTFPTKNPHFANIQAGKLIKTQRIRSAMKEELKPVLEALGISDRAILRNINDIANNSQKDETRLKALFKLSDILDLEEKNTTSITQLTGAVFQGFSDEELETVQRPKELKE